MLREGLLVGETRRLLNGSGEVRLTDEIVPNNFVTVSLLCY
jgi:hypothetical protein